MRRIAAGDAVHERPGILRPGGAGGEQEPARRRTREKRAPRKRVDRRHQNRTPAETPQVRGAPLKRCVLDPPVV